VKEILIISGNRVAPAMTGGQVHSLSIARALARIGHTVRIYSLAGRFEDYAPRSLLRDRSPDNPLEERLSEETNLGLFFGVVQAVTRRLDYPRIWQHAFLSRGFIPHGLRTALRRADIVLSDLPYCAPVPGPWRIKPWFLISHNLEHKLLEQGGPRQQRYAEWMRRIESRAPREYVDIFACADEDRDFFRDHDDSRQLKLPLIRCGVDPRAYAGTREMREKIRSDLGLGPADWLVVFSGSGFAPNVDAFEALEGFCASEREFLARTRVHFLVVGSVAASASRNGNLIVTGSVPEILPYFAAADAGINLVTRGSGSNVKIFEYLAARLPVISTTFGVRGTELTPVTDYLPCTGVDLKEVVTRFIGDDRTYWRSYAEGVWARHKKTCDIQDLVESAIASIPAFHTVQG